MTRRLSEPAVTIFRDTRGRLAHTAATKGPMNPLDDPKAEIHSLVSSLERTSLSRSGEMLSDSHSHALESGVELGYQRSQDQPMQSSI